MQNYLTKFRQDEDGAVTVDWVVLTAAIVGLGVAVILSVSGGAMDHATGLAAHLDSQSIKTH